ncbi:MAG: hypothetical protein M0023_10290 [Desulfobacteraceae bacterium]|nr:hypothetical protein [Desulfobacteraceae bacterium]
MDTSSIYFFSGYRRRILQLNVWLSVSAWAGIMYRRIPSGGVIKQACGTSFACTVRLLTHGISLTTVLHQLQPWLHRKIKKLVNWW